jgi:hypothetical protein
MDVHAKSTAWCLMDQQDEVLHEGKTATSATALTALVQQLGGTRKCSPARRSGPSRTSPAASGLAALRGSVSSIRPPLTQADGD